jgi:1-acyl-sn-glycerol-3-phosphate acyltransferase
LVYNILRFLILPFFKAYINKIIVEGLENIPKSGPVIFAANHPNSFFDGVILALTQKRKLHFLTRSDVFKRKIIAKLLNSIGLIPIYRSRDSGSDISKNNEVFRNVFEIFDKGGCVIIFSEGTSRLDRKIDPLKKGTARLALQYSAIHNLKKKVTVIPIGINYFEFDALHSNLHVEYGEKLDFKEDEEQFVHQEAKAINQFNQKLYARLNNLIFTAHGKKELTDLKIALSFIHHSLFPDESLVNVVNQIIVDESKNQKLREVNEILQKSKIKIEHLTFLTHTNLLLSIFKIILLLPLSVLIFPGFLLLELIILIAKGINKSIGLPRKFSASIVFSASFLLLLILNFICVILSIIYVNPLYLFSLLVFPFWFFFNRFYQVLKKSFQFLLLSNTEKKVLNEVQSIWIEQIVSDR